MENKSLKPKIRFKGFTEAWEQRKLLDMCSIVTKQTGFDYSARIKPSLVVEKNKDTYSFIQNKDFCGNNINFDTDFYIPIEVAKQYPKITLDTPSILVSISGKIGNVGFYNHKEVAFIGGAVGICKLLNEEDGAFSVYELESDYGQKYFQSLIKASSHANITVEDIRNIQLVLPKSDIEKKKIQNLFENIDNLITLHQRKCDKLVNIKKSLLEKMFPKNGNNVPEIRFKGFTEAWEQRKVTDVGKIFIGLVTTMTKNYTDVGTLLIRNSDIKDNHFEFDSNPIHLDEGFAKLNDSRRMHIGDVVTVHTGDVGTSAVITEKEDGSIGFATIVTRPNKEIIDSNYLSTYLNTEQHKNWAINQSTGDGRTNYNLKEFTQLIVPLPSLKEQQCISKYIKQIDNLITLHQKKLNKLKNIKKSLLDKMFV